MCGREASPATLQKSHVNMREFSTAT